MYFTTDKLLNYPAFEALLILINQSTQLNLTPAEIELLEFESLSGTRTRVRLGSRVPTDPHALRWHDGERWFEYDRLDLSDVFDHEQRVYIPLPTSSHDVLDAIYKSSGVLIDTHDVELVAITDELYTLSARYDSLRWVGSVVLKLGPEPVCEQLTIALLGSVLNDFKYPEPANRLSSNLTITLLNDFVYPECDCEPLTTFLIDTVLNDFVQPEFVCEYNELGDSLTNNVLGSFTYPRLCEPTLEFVIPSGELDGFERPTGYIGTDIFAEQDGFNTPSE